MIKTLRITSVLAVIAAAVLIKYFVFPMVVGAGGDERVDKILNTPTVVEQFRETKGSDAKSKTPDVSPLVKEASAFARYLTPKPPVATKTLGGGRTTTVGPTRAVTPKFKVFATTYFEGNPLLSQALIDEPGRERRWVRQASMVGGLFIEQVKDGVVVVKSSKDTYEIPVETSPQAAPMKKTSPTTPASTTSRISSANTTSRSITGRSSPNYSKTTSSVSSTPGTAPANQTSQISPEKANEFIERLKRLQETQAPGNRARIESLISTFKADNAEGQDAESATSSEEQTDSTTSDPNRSSALIKGGKIDTGSTKPARPSTE